MQQKDRRQFIEAMLALPALPLLAQAGDKITPVILRGRVVSLAAEFALRHQITLETAQRGVIYCLKTADSKLYPFLPTDTSAAIYDDERFRQRELQVTARAFPDFQLIEVIKLQSVKWGRVFDLFYFCVVCNISAHKPGPCECCQDPMVLHEEPARDN